jgi:hypothetical protein
MGEDTLTAGWDDSAIGSESCLDRSCGLEPLYFDTEVGGRSESGVSFLERFDGSGVKGETTGGSMKKSSDSDNAESSTCHASF